MNIEQYLKETNTSQEEFAQVIGVTQGRVSHWVNGSQIPGERVIPIESATGGLVTRHEMRPDLYPIEQAA
ncbi:MAG: YdaS family helix-turn-helix protein [Sphingobium sp.]